jgi:hypothetical protein
MDSWAAAWAAALDDLELSLDQTERLLLGENRDGTTAAPWAPPVLEGPMPVDLRTRALELHHRQEEIIRATADAAIAARRQLAVVGKMASGRPDATPVYLDVTA